MKKSKKSLSVLLALLMAVSLFAGCTSQSADTSAATEEKKTADTVETTEEPEAAEEAETAEGTGTREITDMAGRTVTVPAEITSVFSTGPVAAIYLYTLVPDQLLGWNYELNDIEKSVILEKYHSLPNFGMGDSVNYEAVIAAQPTIALNAGTINDTMISDCDALSESLGIPVIAVDGDLASAAEVYRFMGELFAVEEEAEKLAVYAEDTFGDIAAMEIPEEEKVSVYYGNGEDSLETAPNGSPHGKIIDMLGAVNAADLEMGDGSRVQISAEQLLAWNPDVIVVNGEPKADLSGSSAAEEIMNNPDYASLKAVQDGKVYGIPNAPFSWLDRPQGPNRILGMRWLSGLLYPEYLTFDVDEEVREFFSLFYHVELTDEELENIYKGVI
ncbi:MAG: ABC transporter substrate-binding protein [Clostridiales bacterium]|nr:ABC transporter substrate-binding protein [Clostridiales bacterium]